MSERIILNDESIKYLGINKNNQKRKSNEIYNIQIKVLTD